MCCSWGMPLVRCISLCLSIYYLIYQKNGRKITLVPLTPKQVYEDQLKLREGEQKKESEKKRKTEKEKKESEKKRDTEKEKKERLKKKMMVRQKKERWRKK